MLAVRLAWPGGKRTETETVLDISLLSPLDRKPMQEKLPWKYLLTFSSRRMVGSISHRLEPGSSPLTPLDRVQTVAGPVGVMDTAGQGQVVHGALQQSHPVRPPASHPQSDQGSSDHSQLAVLAGPALAYDVGQHTAELN